MTTTTLIADDHAVFQCGLASLLRERSDWEVVAEAGSPALGGLAVDLIRGQRKA